MKQLYILIISLVTFASNAIAEPTNPMVNGKQVVARVAKNGSDCVVYRVDVGGTMYLVNTCGGITVDLTSLTINKIMQTSKSDH